MILSRNTTEPVPFLGIDYLPTRTEDNTNVTHANDDLITPPNNAYYLDGYCGGGQHLNIKNMS
jgi:hypothetical protein